MQTSRFLLSATTALGVAFGAAAAHAQTQIHWWHAMSGELGNKLNEIADSFNASQQEYQVVPTYKGNYTETMTAAVAAFRAGEQPHIVQVF